MGCFYQVCLFYGAISFAGAYARTSQAIALVISEVEPAAPINKRANAIAGEIEEETQKTLA